MKSLQGISQVLAVNVGVNLSSGDALMPKHLLYRPQIGASLDQVCCERMAEGMWRDVLPDVSFFHQVFQ